MNALFLRLAVSILLVSVVSAAPLPAAALKVKLAAVSAI